MKCFLRFLLLFSILFFAIAAFAQNKVVVVPLGGGDKLAGTDGQIQYNDNGKTAGAEVYYKKSTGNVGIGSSEPTAKLEVRGEIRSMTAAGNSRLWGAGRAGSSVLTETWVDSGVAGIEVGVTEQLATWDATQTVCPAATWVCDDTELYHPFNRIGTGYTAISCNGSDMTDFNMYWTANIYPNMTKSYAVAEYINISGQWLPQHTEPCYRLRVLCCRNKQ